MVVVIAERIDDRLGPAHDEYRLAAPDDFQHLAVLEFRGIDRDRRAQRLGARARLPRREERDRGERDADGAGAAVAAVSKRRRLWSTCVIDLIALPPLRADFALCGAVTRCRIRIPNCYKSSRKPLWP